MKIPYRTQQTLKRVVIAVLVIVLAALLLWLSWILWLGRYVIYTREGAVIDMDKSSAHITGQIATPPLDGTGIQIYYNEGEDAVVTTTELTQVVGYYIDQKTLESEMATIREQILALPAGTPVMIDVKNSAGNFFYNTSVSKARLNTIDPAAMDELIKFLNSSGMYTIARLPALRDYTYGLNNVPDGIHHSSMLYLWQDEGGCYWLNPSSQGTMNFLTGIANELKTLGFDEVVFSEFRIPDSDQIAFSGDKLQTLATAAQILVNTCGNESFTVSFASSEGFALPTGRSRLYVENAEPINIQSIVDNALVPDTAVNLVFVTSLHDTRFDTYGVLRPLSSADYAE